MSLSTRTIFNGLQSAGISFEMITILRDLLDELLPITKEILGPNHLSNLEQLNMDMNAALLEKMFILSHDSALKLDMGLNTAIRKFRRIFYQFPQNEQAKLNNFIIHIPSKISPPKVSIRFADIFFVRDTNKAVEKPCILTSQIYLWQLLVNSGLQAQYVPPLMHKIATIKLCSIEPLQQTFPQQIVEHPYIPAILPKKGRAIFKREPQQAKLNAESHRQMVVQGSKLFNYILNPAQNSSHTISPTASNRMRIKH